jgi:hypothetical protein
MNDVLKTRTHRRNVFVDMMSIFLDRYTCMLMKKTPLSVTYRVATPQLLTDVRRVIHGARAYHTIKYDGRRDDYTVTVRF